MGRPGGAAAARGGRLPQMGKAVKLKTVWLACWNDEEFVERAGVLRAAGYEVGRLRGETAELRAMDANPPVAVVIDLSRLPSHGRAIGWALRERKGTRAIPLVFVDGEAGKVERVRTVMPDATYTTWGRIRSALKGAIARPPANPVVPISNSGGYSGTPLPKKLGIKEGSSLGLVDAPKGFEVVLGDLPGVTMVRNPKKACDLVLWFVTGTKDLGARMDSVPALAPKGLWICWPKRASGVPTDLTEEVVRKAGLENGLVDYKVCAVDGTWSGLKFARRKS